MAEETTPLIPSYDGDERHEEPKTPLASFIRRNSTLFGTVLAVISGITFTTANVIQKLAPTLDFWNLLLIRAAVQTTVMTGLLAYRKTNPAGPRDVRAFVVGQGFTGGLLLLCIFIAIKHIPLGDASAIFFSAPFFTMLLSTFTLRERFGCFRAAVSFILLSGVILLCRPPAIFAPDNVRGRGFGFVGMVTAWSVPVLSAVVTILNRLCKRVDYFVLTFWFGVGALAVSTLGITIMTVGSKSFMANFFTLSEAEWAYTLAVVVLGIIGNIIMTIALRYVTPAKAMVFRSFEVVVNYVLQLTLFTTSSTPFHATDPMGAAFITLAVLIMGLEPVVMRKFSWSYL